MKISNKANEGICGIVNPIVGGSNYLGSKHS
jgi:hypothetical protein